MMSSRSFHTAPVVGHPDNARHPRVVTVWLAVCTVLVLLMIVVGGYTRLSQSGLSMVDWKPLTGVLPPLSDSAWQDEFERYQAFPEYQQVNKGMTLSGFKRIYLVEFAHRMLGRAIGIVFFMPFLLFCFLGYIRRPYLWRLSAVLLLGGCQALLGWYMVKSGLVDQPHVSQYRLTAHLSLAVVIFAALFWLTLKSTRPRYSQQLTVASALTALFVGMVILMIVTGGFMAGTRAGYIHNTFPTVSGAWIPAGLLSIEPAWRNFFENPTTIQVVHRYLAFITAIVGCSIAATILLRRLGPLQGAAIAVLVALGLQVALGIVTLVWRVPLPAALLHQFGAMCLLACALYLAFKTRQL